MSKSFRRRTALRRATGSVVENLETRRLMHAGHDHGDGPETLRVDAGASAPYIDSVGQVWLADSGFIGGGTDNNAFTVAGTSDPRLFTSRRAGTFGYSHPAADGNYKLNLLFADWVTTAGRRKFNVDAEGQRVLTNFDVAASGGGKRALVKSFDVTVTGGMIDLSFSEVVGNAVLSAFELIPVSVPDPVAPAAPTELYVRPLSSSKIGLTWMDNSDNETGFEIEYSTNDGATFAPLVTAGINATAHPHENLPASTKYVYRVRAVNNFGESAWSNLAEGTTSPTPPPPPPGGTTLRVDAAGNSTFIDSSGKSWAKDAGFTGGYANTGTFAVAGTIDDALYATRRTGDFTYSAPVANGDYTLRLLFADHYTSAGQRRFNVAAEGNQILTNFDIVAQAGSKSALVKSFNVAVTDGQLDLAFTSVTGYAALSAFELVPAGPVTIPLAPANLTATGLPGGKIRLAWQDKSDDEDEFVIERSTNGGAFAVVGSRGAGQTDFEDANLDPNVTYTYRVRAKNTGGTGDPSNEASANPQAGNPVDTWTRITWSTRTAAPIGRAEALHAVIDGKLYVFAGFSGNNGPVARSDVYNPATNSWTRLADMPRRLTHAGVATVGRDVYFAGGYIGTGPGYQQQFGTREVWRYNVDANAYTRMPDLPAALAGGGLVAIGRKLHYFGGNNAARQDVAVHYALDLDNVAAGWATKPSMITARSHMGYADFNGLIYAIGGQKGNDGALTAQKVVEVYDPTTNSWSTRTSMPKGVNHISSSTFVMGGRILTLGGQTSHGSAIADVYAYDPAADTWTSLSPLPTARFSGVAGTINGMIYFTGGSSQTTTWRGIVG